MKIVEPDAKLIVIFLLLKTNVIFFVYLSQRHFKLREVYQMVLSKAVLAPIVVDFPGFCLVPS